MKNKHGIATVYKIGGPGDPTKKGDSLQSGYLLFKIWLVPEARIELALPLGKPDFESGASTNFTTPAEIGFIP